MIEIGRAASDIALILKYKRWAGLEDFTNSITQYEFREGNFGNIGIRAQLFYAFSWLGVHYIQSTPEISKGFAPYINLLNQGVDPSEAFEQGFGIDQAEFGEQLQSYWRRNKFRTSQARFGDFLQVPEISSRTISEEEADAALWEVRVLFLPGSTKDEEQIERRAKARKELKAFVDKVGFSTSLAEIMVGLEIVDRQYDTAIAIAEETLRRYPDDLVAVKTLADALFHRFQHDREAYRDDIVRSRELFARVLDADPTSPIANSHYPSTFELGDVRPDDRAVKAVTFNLSYNRNPLNFDTYLQAANVFAATGEAQFACSLLDKVGRWIRKTDEDLTDEQREELAEMNRRSSVEMLDEALQAVPGGC